MANTQHVQFSDENGDIYYLENQTEDVRDASGKPLSDGGDLSEASVTFTADSTRTLPKSGSRFKAFCGSVLKFLSDLKTVSFSGSYNDLSNKPSIPSGAAASQAVANNCTTTAAGSVLDARQGKVLMDKANQLSSEFKAHTHDAGKITGTFLDKTYRWQLGNGNSGSDYAELRKSGASPDIGLSFVFHDTSANTNIFHNVFDKAGNFMLAEKDSVDALSSKAFSLEKEVSNLDKSVPKGFHQTTGTGVTYKAVNIYYTGGRYGANMFLVNVGHVFLVNAPQPTSSFKTAAYAKLVNSYNSSYVCNVANCQVIADSSTQSRLKFVFSAPVNFSVSCVPLTPGCEITKIEYADA